MVYLQIHQVQVSSSSSSLLKTLFDIPARKEAYCTFFSLAVRNGMACANGDLSFHPLMAWVESI